jgi:hypothetical protein
MYVTMAVHVGHQSARTPRDVRHPRLDVARDHQRVPSLLTDVANRCRVRRGTGHRWCDGSALLFPAPTGGPGARTTCVGYLVDQFRCLSLTSCRIEWGNQFPLPEQFRGEQFHPRLSSSPQLPGQVDLLISDGAVGTTTDVGFYASRGDWRIWQRGIRDASPTT